jgi:hypothetical protein
MSIKIPNIHDLKQLHKGLSNLPEEELDQIRVLPEGTKLETGVSYIDLKDIDKGEFVATDEMRAEPNNWYVAQKDIPLNLWYVLLDLKEKELTESEANKQSA